MTAPTQEGRYMRVKSDLGQDALLLKRFWGREAVSEPFDFEAEVLAVDPVGRDDLLQKKVDLVVIQEDGTERTITGNVRSLVHLGLEGEFHAYRIRLAPAFWFLSLFRDCRIFQEKDVKEIVDEVLDGRAFSVAHRWDCKGAFPKRDFTVQYRESDLDFVSRLLEEEGVFYFFEHDASEHTLVLADHQGALEASPTQSVVKYERPGGRVHTEGMVDQVTSEESVWVGDYAATDFNYETPSTDLAADVSGAGLGQIYDYPGGWITKGDGDRFAELRAEAEESHRVRLRASGNSLGPIPGYRLELQATADLDDEYMVLEVEHRSGTVNYHAAGGSDDDGPPYRNAFLAVPYAMKYRPPRRTPLAVIPGAQTAIVVGPDGEEIYSDEYGRVKVRFHWDGLSPENGESSCWIRVSSTWAGNKWGAFQLPRIGQEVVVEFLEGNPDRPLVTGSVYNAEQMPPWDASPTVSGWKSNSSKKGGAESNELKFEDKKDSEEIFLRAQKNHTVEVVNDETNTVGHDRTTKVEHDDTLTVKNHQKVTVSEGDRTIDVKRGKITTTAGQGDISTTAKQGKIETLADLGAISTTAKVGNISTVAKAGKISFEALQAIEFKVGPTTVKIDPMGVTINGLMIKIEAKAMGTFESKGMLMVKGGIGQVQATGPLMVKGLPTMIG